MKNFIKIGLAIATVMLLGSLESATAQGNLVFNGSFDTGVSGWAASHIAGTGYDSKGNPGGCFILEGPSSSSSISQTISGLTSGTTYLISGDYNGLSLSAPDSSFGVEVNGNFLFTGSSSSWQSFSLFYTATSSSVDLSLFSLSGTLTSYRVDNISMQAIPEPCSLCLLGIGGTAGLIFFRRKV